MLHSSILYGMKTILSYTTILTLLLAPTVFVRAEDDILSASISATTTIAVPPVQSNKSPRPLLRARADARMEAKAEIKDMREERRESMSKSNTQERRASSSEEIRAMRVEIKSKIDARKADLKTEIASLKAEHKAAVAKRLDTKAKERVEKTITTVYKKLTERIQSLTKVDAEIARRITMFSSATTSVSAEALAQTVALQVTAKELLANAKVDVEATKTVISTEVNATTTKEIIRALVVKSENSIKAAAEAYKKTLEMLRTIKKPISVEVSGKSEVSSTN